MERVEPMIDEARIAARIAELGNQVRQDFGDVPIVCVAVLKGSIFFLADLMRAIPGDARCEFLGVSSYHGTTSTGVVRITHDLPASVEGKHVLIVEDIVDTGLTLDFLLRSFSMRNPAALKVACLLDKPSRRKVHVPVDYVGFTIPDEFVVGYGLDFDERFRNLPWVGIYKG